ncbi:uncharacterized protein FIESC28_09675 [Fusarium coffeatum]|uniref:Uncharacterized protein n=1 Tax=Fusarium coffeatum TaxID=231269 RepID=A0A366QYE9_9HYPO|nr:uncharacterized protein FIESC28_09675 [Fusarium coffeatum]RBR09929.1 hypothetical protein FIESC28_09675 [Fusarium coffeatum]
MATPKIVSSTATTISDLGKELSAAKARVITLEQEVLSGRREIAQEASKQEALLQETKRLQHTISTMSLSIENLIQELQKSHREKSAIDFANRSMATDIHNTRMKMAEMDSQLRITIQQLTAASSDSMKMRNHIMELQKSVSAAEGMANRARLSESELAQSLDHYKHQSASMASYITVLTSNYIPKLEEFAMKQPEESYTKRNVDAQLAEAKSQINVIKKDLRRSRKDAKNFRKQNWNGKARKAKPFPETRLGMVMKDTNRVVSGEPMEQSEYIQVDVSRAPPMEKIGEVTHPKMGANTEEEEGGESMKDSRKSENSIRNGENDCTSYVHIYKGLPSPTPLFEDKPQPGADFAETSDVECVQIAQQAERIRKLEAKNEGLENEIDKLRSNVCQITKDSEQLKQQVSYHQGQSFMEGYEILKALGRNRRQLVCHIFDGILRIITPDDIDEVPHANRTIATLEGFYASVGGRLTLYVQQADKDAVLFRELLDRMWELTPASFQVGGLVEPRDVFSKIIALRRIVQSLRKDAWRELAGQDDHYSMSFLRPNELLFPVPTNGQPPRSQQAYVVRITFFLALISVTLWTCNWLPISFRPLLCLFMLRFGALWIERIEATMEDEGCKHLQSVCNRGLDDGHTSKISDRNGNTVRQLTGLLTQADKNALEALSPKLGLQGKLGGKKKERKVKC